ncbi:MAG: hypothetical protein JWN41_1444, partial [Thermoleophilia bacterium]|nr:hypothetical protein [Thermoleophilia bacterium]
MTHRVPILTILVGTLAALTCCALAAPGASLATPVITTIAPVRATVGQTVTVSGTVDSHATGEHVQVEQQLGGVWTQVGIASVTTTGGVWKVAFHPTIGGAVRAVQTTGSAGVSAERTLVVSPSVTAARITGGRVYPFLGTTAVWKVAPSAYPAGAVRVNISIDGRAAGWTKGRIAHGVATARVPTNGTGMFTLQVVLPARGGYAQVGDKRLRFYVRGAAVGRG